MTTWRKSRHSGSDPQSDCVEVASLAGNKIGLRDSKAPDAGHHSVSREALKGLLVDIKAGKLDL